MALFSTWKQREYEEVQREQGEIARRVAAADLQAWKSEVEKGIRQDAVSRSQAVTVGKVTEHIAPYLPDFGYNPKDSRFIGSPVDFVVFDGLNDGAVVQVVFVEVKAGSSAALGARQRQIRDAVKSGRIKWEESAVGASSVCYADGRLYLHAENGDVVLVEPSPESYREKGRFTPPDQPQRANQMEKAWAYPVVANGQLYLRDHGTLWCYDVRATK